MIQKRKSTFGSTLASALLALIFFAGVSAAFAQELSDEPLPAVPVPSQIQRVTIDDVTGKPAWQIDTLATAGLRFMIRGKEALAWALNIDEMGFNTPAIESSYRVVLTIVNSLFILGLLAIAVMWIFSVLVPRRALKRVMFVYVLAVIFVNFALPINRLLIDGTNLLQRTFLIKDNQPILISHLVETPAYGDSNTLGYVQITEAFSNTHDETLTIEITNEPELPTAILAAPEDSLYQEFRLTGNQPITTRLEKSVSVNPYAEQSWFTFGLLGLTGLGYLLIALLFVVRIVILWALMILSPLLFLLVIFKVTRGYFYNWLSLYGRWLLIGPLAALGITLVVNIWQTVGLPLKSTYVSEQTFGALTNIGFVLPGSTVVNTLSTPGQMMEYILFLLMLYIPIFFALALTRQRVLSNLVNVFAEGRQRVTTRREREGGTSTTERTTEKTTIENKTTQAGGGLKELFNTQLAKVTRTVLPGLTTGGTETSARGALTGINRLESASQFLPQHLAVASPDEMLSLLGARPDSRHSREQALNKLAAPELASSSTERKQITAVREEIEKRAASGNAEATLLKTEIDSKRETITTNKTETTRTILPASNVTPEKKPEKKTESITPEKLETIKEEILEDKPNAT